MIGLLVRLESSIPHSGQELAQPYMGDLLPKDQQHSSIKGMPHLARDPTCGEQERIKTP